MGRHHGRARLGLFLISALGIAAGCSTAEDGEPGERDGSALMATRVAVADTFVRLGSNRSFGSAKRLETVRSNDGVTEQAYLRFDVGSGSVTKAVLRIYAVNGSSNSLDVFAVSNTTWAEATTTWESRPAVDGPLVGTLAATSSGRWYEVDVTAAVTPGTASVSLALVPRSSDNFDLASRESANEPELVLMFADGAIGGGTTSDAGTTDSGGDAGADSSSPVDSGTTLPRPKCIDPLTGLARTGSDVVELTADIAGRFRVYDTPANACVYGNGHKVDQGHVEPANASTWTRTECGAFWEEYYHSSDNAVAVRVKQPVVENIAMYNSGQGIVFGAGTEYFALRDAYIQHAGDDAIESDFLVGGVIDDVLVDKAFVGLAWRLSSAPCQPTPNNVVKLSNSIIRVFPQYGVYPGYTSQSIPGYGTVFKWEKACQYATKLEVRNTIIVANQDGMSGNNLNLDANGNLTVSENNTLLWLGDAPYTGTIPPGFKVVTDPKVFTDAWQAWFARHPDIAKPSASPDMNYDLAPVQ